MKKFSVILLIISLIIFTAFVKNSTKKIEDKIFVSQENLRLFKKELENTKLENDYLSSSEKLMEFQNLYFEDELIKKKIKKLRIIKINSNELEMNIVGSVLTAQ